MDNKKIFITGGAGYCGSRLVPRLLEQGYKITVYDIMYFGDDFLPKSKTYTQAQINSLIKAVNDIKKPEQLKNFFQR